MREVDNPAPGVLHTRFERCLHLVDAEELILLGDALMDAGQTVDAFHDWERVETYEPKAREALIRWAIARKSQIGAVHILLRSGLVRMAVSIASLALQGMLVQHHDRASFEAALAEALHRRR